MEVKAFSDDLKIVSSGSLLMATQDSQLRLDVKATDSFSFSIVFRFVREDGRMQAIDKKIEETSDGATVIYSCVNFDNGLGTGTIEPLELATVSGNELLISFWVYLMGDSDRGARKIEYSMFEKTVD